MGKPMSDFNFRFMSFGYRFRDLFLPRRNVLDEVGIKAGANILDYGCGPGSYSVIAAQLVGATGKVYALDMHPLAIQRVQKAATKKRLTNVEAIRSDCATGLENSSVDVVLLYDVFHSLSDPNAVLKELHRVLKSSGILSFTDHHMNENEIVSSVTNSGLFKLLRKGERTHSFSKEP